MKRTSVIFRQFPDGDVIALFPHEVADLEGNIMSYMRIGQHGAACPSLALELEVPRYDDALELFKELERLGYDNLEDCTYSIEKRGGLE